MRVPVFAPADAALALLLLSVLILVAVWGLMPMEAGSGFVMSAGIGVHPPGPGGVSRPAPEGRVNPNRADAGRLADVPGMDPDMADAIVRFREDRSPFGRPSDLERIPEIGPKRLRKIRPYLSVEEETWPTR